MTTVRFQEVALRGKFRWKDASGKWHQKTQKFFQTINPFNKSATGEPKTYSEIKEELIVERDRWYVEMSAGNAKEESR